MNGTRIRLCTHGEGCQRRLCQLASDPRYRSLAGLGRGPCAHLGAETGETVACGTCRGNVRVKLRACAVYDTCTPAKPLPGVACCAGCPDYTAPGSTPPTVRDLMYYVAPAPGPVWRKNVAMLLQRIGLFNGRRLVTIAQGQMKQRGHNGSRMMLHLEPAGLVVDAFSGHDVEFITVRNNAGLREVTGLVPMLERVASTDPARAVFFGQAKGVTYPVNAAVSVHRWTEILYETCLDYWPLVARQLTTHPCTGSFKKIGSYFGDPSRPHHSNFHYSGSFYWLRSHRLFSRPSWRNVTRRWFGVEPYPGEQFTAAEAGSLFCATGGVLDLYDPNFLRTVIEPEYAAWKAEHLADRMEVAPA